MLRLALDWFRSTRFYKIFFARANQDKGARLLYVISFISFMIDVNLFFDFFNPVVDIGQMKHSLVTISSVQQVRRSPCGDRIWVRTQSGSSEVYRALLNEDAWYFLKNNIGQDVVIWNQPLLYLSGSCPSIFQIKYKEKLILDYAPTWRRRVQASERLPYLFGAILIFWLLPLCYVFFRFRHDEIN